MAITVDSAGVSPTSIAAPGGTLTHTVRARTQGGSSQMRITYSLFANDGYLFANGTRFEQLPAQPVTASGSSLSKSLRLMHEPGQPTKPSIDISALGFEVGSGGREREIEIPLVKVTIAGVAAAPAAAAARVPGGVTMPAAAAAPRPAAAAAPRRAAAPSARRPAGLGKRLRARRKERGMTQREVAKKVGVSSSTISRVERGHEPSGRVRRAIEGFLGG